MKRTTGVRRSQEPFEHLPAAATVVDARGRLLQANAEARRLSGTPRAGQTCREFWQCRLPEARCPLRRALEGHPVRRAKVRLGHPDGCAIERIGAFTDARGRRRAVILTGPAASYFRRMGELRREASFDGLSRVHNRRSFDALTAHALRTDRRRGPSAFLMLDIDGLKRVNDRLGHAAGDALIARLGTALAGSARRQDVVGRVGGDEFAVYCPGLTRRRARALVDRIERALREDNAARPGEPHLSVQIGLAWSSGRRARQLRAAADRCLLRRKQAARAGRPAAGGAYDPLSRS